MPRPRCNGGSAAKLPTQFLRGSKCPSEHSSHFTSFVALFATGCAEVTPLSSELESTGPAAAILGAPGDQGLMRAFATSLGDEELRTSLFEDLRDSPYDGKRIHLNSYLLGERGAPLLEATSAILGVSTPHLRNHIKKLPSLELRIPSDAHQVRWAGGPEIILVGITDEEQFRGMTGATGYGTDGAAVDVNIHSLPEAPVLSIAPSTRAWREDSESARARAPKKKQGTVSTGDEMMMIMSCSSGNEFIPCETNDGTGGGGGTLPPAGGVAISSSAEECWGPFGGDGDDDSDSLIDQCEYELAMAFRPYLAIDTSSPYTDREPYWAVRRDGVETGVQIFYAMAYNFDGGDVYAGFKAHQGDIEWVIVKIHKHGTKWYVDYIRTSAHWDTIFSDSSTDGYASFSYPSGVERTRPLIWVATSKHANYRSQSICNNSGPFDSDDCSTATTGTGAAHDVEILYSANLGNYTNPLANVTTSRKSSNSYYGGQDCFWCGDTFRGWIAVDHEEGATDYLEPLTTFGF